MLLRLGLPLEPLSLFISQPGMCCAEGPSEIEIVSFAKHEATRMPNLGLVV